MKILLVNPLVAPHRPPEVCNLGLAYVAAALRLDGHRVGVLDLDAERRGEDEVRDYLSRADYDAVGIGTLITGFRTTRWLARLIREVRPKARIWIGNSIGTTAPEMVLRKMPVDAVVLGEGEDTVRALARAEEEGRDLSTVAGVAHRGPDRVLRSPERPVIADVDSIPMPAWDLFRQDVYMAAGMPGLPAPKMYVISTRGCPYHCTYCYHPYQNSKVRLHSAERVVEEIRELKGRYGARSIVFGDDLFTVNKKRVYEICDLLERHRVNVRWSASGRINIMDPDMLKRMKSAGCVMLGFGIESGSQRILDNIKKQATVAMGRDAIALCRGIGIEPACSFMIGNVGETRETVAETVDFIKANDLPPTVFFYATPYPGTELYEHGLREGLIRDEEAIFESYGEQNDTLLVNFTKMTNPELAALKKAAEDDLFVSFGKRHPLRWLAHYYVHLRYNVKIHGWGPVLKRIRSKAARLFGR